MVRPDPRHTDAILGSQNPPPVSAAVLGGIEGKEQRIQQLLDRFGTIHQLFKFDTLKLDRTGEIVSIHQKHNYLFRELLEPALSLDMVLIPSGSFLMGSEDYYNEQPIHSVDLPSFHLSRYPITQSQFRAVMGSNPAFFTGNDLLPVENISWYDAQKFCQKLTKDTDKFYRLPSEAEWEYACRAGTYTLFSYGDCLSDRVANFGDGYIYKDNPQDPHRRKTSPVDSFPANNFGISDLHGNVWEWCEDLWHKHYRGAPRDRVAWTTNETNSCRVLRGGSWLSDPWFCRSTNRSYLSPESKNNVVGFRVALSME